MISKYSNVNIISGTTTNSFRRRFTVTALGMEYIYKCLLCELGRLFQTHLNHRGKITEPSSANDYMHNLHVRMRTANYVRNAVVTNIRLHFNFTKLSNVN